MSDFFGRTILATKPGHNIDLINDGACLCVIADFDFNGYDFRNTFLIEMWFYKPKLNLNSE